VKGGAGPGRPLRVLFTIPNFDTAGSGGAMVAIVERLDPDRFEASVGVSRRGGGLDEQVEASGRTLVVAPHRVPAFPRATFLQRAWRAARPFRGRFDVWHSFNWQGEYSEPVIARLAGARAWIYTKKNMNWNRPTWHVRSSLASRILAQNTDMLREFFGGVRYRRKTRLVPRGVDARRYHPDAPPGYGLRARLGLPREATVAACVSHLLPVKGHPTLLRAAAAVPGLHLAIAGRPADVAYAEGLRRTAGELGIADRVHFLGAVGDVPGLLAESELAVLPTVAKYRMEGCPVALLEAMAAGRACVATDVPGSRDVVEHGSSGLLVPPEDPGAMARALETLTRDPDLRGRLGAGARARIEARYTIEREVADHEEVYDELR